MKNANVTQSYIKLKKGMMLLVHLIIVFIFYLVWTEASVHADIRQTINEYVSEVEDDHGNHLHLHKI